MIFIRVPTITDNLPHAMRTEVIVIIVMKTGGTAMRIGGIAIVLLMTAGTVIVHHLTIAIVIMILYPVTRHGTVRSTENHVSNHYCIPSGSFARLKCDRILVLFAMPLT